MNSKFFNGYSVTNSLYLGKKTKQCFWEKLFLSGELFFHILIIFLIFGAHFCQFSTFSTWNFGRNGFQIKSQVSRAFQVSIFHQFIDSIPCSWIITLPLSWKLWWYFGAILIGMSLKEGIKSNDTLTFDLNISCGYGKLSYKHSSKQKIMQVGLWFKKSHWKHRDSSGVLTPLSLKTCRLSNVYIICWS